MFCSRKERSITIIHAHIYNTETERSSLNVRSGDAAKSADPFGIKSTPPNYAWGIIKSYHDAHLRIARTIGD